MSGIARSFGVRLRRIGCTLVPHALGRMEPRIAPVWRGVGPVWRHPAGPAELTDGAEPPRPDRSGPDRELDVPLELVAVVGEDEIGQRLAQVAGRQEADVLRQARDVDPDADLVLDAEDAAAEQHVLAQRALPPADR